MKGPRSMFFMKSKVTSVSEMAFTPVKMSKPGCSKYLTLGVSHRLEGNIFYMFPVFYSNTIFLTLTEILTIFA